MNAKMYGAKVWYRCSTCDAELQGKDPNLIMGIGGEPYCSQACYHINHFLITNCDNTFETLDDY